MKNIKNHGIRSMWGYSNEGMELGLVSNVADVEGMLLALSVIVDAENAVIFSDIQVRGERGVLHQECHLGQDQ